MKEKIKKILIEVPTIVLSVIIALGINEWNVDRERKNLANNVIAAIREEVTANKERVQTVYEYHVPLVDNLVSGKHRMFSIPIKQFNAKSITAEVLQVKITELLERFGEVVEKTLVVKQINDSLFRMQYHNQMLSLKIKNDTLMVFGRGNISLRPAFIKNNSWKIAQTAQIAPYLEFELIAKMSELDQLQNHYQKTLEMIVEMLYKGGTDVTPAMQDMLFFEKQLLVRYDEILTLLDSQ